MTNVTIKARFWKNQIHFRFKKLFMKHVRETAKKSSSSIVSQT